MIYISLQFDKSKEVVNIVWKSLNACENFKNTNVKAIIPMFKKPTY